MNEQTFNQQKPTRPARGVKVLRIIGMTLAGIVLAVLLGFLFALVIKALWNWLMPTLFGLGTITYWQAFGIFILAKLLFGGFPHPHDKHHNDHIHKKVRDRWHCWIGVEDETKWEHFNRFWEEEGKAAFADYVKRMDSDKKKD